MRDSGRNNGGNGVDRDGYRCRGGDHVGGQAKAQGRNRGGRGGTSESDHPLTSTKSFT